MTCIVGIVEDGRITMGGDSAGSDGYGIKELTQSKVFRNGEFLIGYTTSFRLGQILQYVFEPPDHKIGMSVYAYMVSNFVPELQKCLESTGYGKENGNFLIGYRGRLLQLQGDFAVTENACRFDACGCGKDYAMGAMFSCSGSPVDRIDTALLAATEFSDGVCKPFNIEIM